MSEVYQTIGLALDNLNNKQQVLAQIAALKKIDEGHNEEIEALKQKDIVLVAQLLDTVAINEEQSEEIDRLMLDNDKQTKALATILKILENASFENDDMAVRKALTHILEIAEALTI